MTSLRPATGAPRDLLWLFPLLIPAVLVTAGAADFGFDRPGLLDPFMYFGYFWHYPEHLWVFDDNSNYKISRLPWILPGYLVHSAVGAAAPLILACVLISVGAVMMYLFARDTIGNRSVAVVLGIAWAGFTLAHGPGGWNYHMLPAVTYYLAACVLVVRSARQSARTPLAAAAGACFAAAVHTHLFLVAFAPLLLILLWAALEGEASSRAARLARASLMMAAGGVALTAALAGINRATGGAWLFFMPQIEIALQIAGGDRWWMSTAQWLPSARHLVLPLAFLAMGLPVALRRPRERFLVTHVGLAWAALAIMAYFQFVRRVTTLDYPEMSFALHMHTFP